MNFPRRRALIVACLALALNACDKPTPQETNISSLATSSDPLVQYLIDMGFRSDMIEDMGDYYHVEGDIVISKRDIKIMMGEGLSKPTQTASYNIINWGTVGNITVFASSSLNSNWSQAAMDAISNWNSMNDTKLNLVPGPSGAMINIYPDTEPSLPSDLRNLSQNIAGKSWYPSSSGDPGYYVSINMDNASTPIQGQKVYTVTHELGHTFGFRHTNWQSAGEPVDPYGAFRIPWTPSSDGSSIMNGASIPNWCCFSSYDAIATKVLYPVSLSTPAINSVQVQYPGITNTALLKLYFSASNNTAFVEVWRKKDSEPWVLRAIEDADFSPFPDTVFRTGSVQIFQYKLRARNFKGDLIGTEYSNTVTAYVN